MLIPTKAKSPQAVSVLASLDEKAGSPGGETTYVPVVSLEYSLPGPVGGHRLPAPQNNPPQPTRTGRLRLPRHLNLRPRLHIRHTLAGKSQVLCGLEIA